MKIVTVTTNQNGHVLPVVFKSTDVIDFESAAETNYWRTLDGDINGVDFIDNSFMIWLKVLGTKGLKSKRRFFVYGDINKIGDLIMNGGTLPSTKKEHDRVMKTKYIDA